MLNIELTDLERYADEWKIEIKLERNSVLIAGERYLNFYDAIKILQKIHLQNLREAHEKKNQDWMKEKKWI